MDKKELQELVLRGVVYATNVGAAHHYATLSGGR